jgi:hypothetical protein
VRSGEQVRVGIDQPNLNFANSSVPGPPVPHPTAVHPKSIADAHSFPSDDGSDSLFDSLPESYPRPPINHVVQVKMNVSAGPAKSVQYVFPSIVIRLQRSRGDAIMS